MSPADTYTHGHHESVLRSHRWRTAENSAGYLLPHLHPGLSLLDIGCGPGTITLDLAQLVAPGLTIGVDRAGQPLISANAGAIEQRVSNVAFTVGDVYQLDFPDDSFDVVHAHQLLQHLTDPVAALREMRRVCRPGGVVAARDADYAAMTWYPADPRLTDWLSLYHQVAHNNGAQPDAGRRLLAWAHAAGFPDVSASASVWCYATPDERAWWGNTWAERVTRSAFAEQAVAAGFADPNQLAELAAGWREWAEQPDGWFAVLNSEILCRLD
ncbi:MAG: methyltransferase domain-containing protein [Nakamurella sp.]